jgi:hypothetical protein
MTRDVQYDKKLWFFHEGCEGKHYLITNPHTSPGRMYAFCPKKNSFFCVSKIEMGEMSEQSKYWIEGFLHGNQPDPPSDAYNEFLMTDENSEPYQRWVESLKLFSETGYWSDEERECENCGKMLLNSNPDEICGNC